MVMFPLWETLCNYFFDDLFFLMLLLFSINNFVLETHIAYKRAAEVSSSLGFVKVDTAALSCGIGHYGNLSMLLSVCCISVNGVFLSMFRAFFDGKAWVCGLFMLVLLWRLGIICGTACSIWLHQYCPLEANRRF